MTKHPNIFAALADDFGPGEVKQRVQAGRTLHYISARTAMNRLDSVLGPENWRDEYRETAQGAIVCRIWFRVPGTDEWLWREDGGAAAGMNEADNDAKSGFSDAFKRTCVKLGVGRILYGDGVPEYGGGMGPGSPEPPRIAEPSRRPEPARQPERRGQWGGPHGPQRPELPPVDEPGDHDAIPGRRDPSDRPPADGRQLYAWAKKRQDAGGRAEKLIFRLNAFGKKNGHPDRMVDWSADESAAAFNYALELLGLVEPMEA